MKLSTRMVVGWIAVFAGGATLAFDVGPWLFLATLFFSDLLRTRFEPRIPRDVERRRRWILLPPAIAFLGIVMWLGFPESATHPVHIVGGFGFVVAVAWLIRDDIRVYRQMEETRYGENPR